MSAPKWNSVFVVMALGCRALCAQPADPYRGWQSYGGGPDNIHYSSLKQIHIGNVSQLQVAWTYRTGDAREGSDMQCNPIMVDGILYAVTPGSRVIALTAATGKKIWMFDPLQGKPAGHPSRGVTFWKDGRQSRIFVTFGSDLYSVDARSGRPDPAFGHEGRVDLKQAFDRPAGTINVSVTTPGIVFRDLIILGSSVPEQHPSTPGDIRAYDARTGKLRWTFHTIPRPGEPGYETWPPEAWKYTGGANNWAGMAVDLRRGLVYVPTGSASFDFYGADRWGDNLYANSLLCLDAASGKLRWHFQNVRHDVWDLDFPCPPLLVTVLRKGKPVDAVAQAGKDGFLFLLNRETGESLFPLVERAVPASQVEGEKLAPRQRVPLKPAPFARQEVTSDILTQRTPAAHEWALDQLTRLDHGGRFLPPGKRGTLVLPGLSGGAEWGGGAYDPETHLYYVNANEMGWILRLVPPSATLKSATARQIYLSRCASCHRPDMKGAPPEYPAVDRLTGKFDDARLTAFIAKGGGRMPGFANLGEAAIQAVSALLLTGENRAAEVRSAQPLAAALRYTVDGYNKFLDPDGYPAIAPPWGTLNAINLDTGEYAWKIPLGEYPELAAKGVPNTGTENHGGGIVTAGGLFFIGATPQDRKLRAFDKGTGRLLWETTLPFGGNATPAMYEIRGRQYLVIAAGGGRGGPSGDVFIAFSLP